MKKRFNGFWSHLRRATNSHNTVSLTYTIMATAWKKICRRRFCGIRNRLLRVSRMLLMLLHRCTARVNMLLRIMKPHRDITKLHYLVSLNLKAKIRRTITYFIKLELCTKTDLERKLIFQKPLITSNVPLRWITRMVCMNMAKH